jgi:hypothetical protein
MADNGSPQIIIQHQRDRDQDGDDRDDHMVALKSGQ